MMKKAIIFTVLLVVGTTSVFSQTPSFFDYSNLIQQNSSAGYYYPVDIDVNNNDISDAVFFGQGHAYCLLNSENGSLSNTTYDFESYTYHHQASPTGNAVLARKYNYIKIYDLTTNGFNTPSNSYLVKSYPVIGNSPFSIGSFSTDNNYDLVYAYGDELKTAILPADDKFVVTSTNDTVYVGDTFQVENNANILQILTIENSSGPDDIAVLYKVNGSVSQTFSIKIKCFKASLPAVNNIYEYEGSSAVIVADNSTVDFISSDNSIHIANIDNSSLYHSIVYCNNSYIKIFKHQYNNTLSLDKTLYHSLTSVNYRKNISFYDHNKDGLDDLVTTSEKYIGITINNSNSHFGSNNSTISYLYTDSLPYAITPSYETSILPMDYHGLGAKSILTCLNSSSTIFLNSWICNQNARPAAPSELNFEWDADKPCILWDKVNEADISSYKIYRKYAYDSLWTQVGTIYFSSAGDRVSFTDNSYSRPQYQNRTDRTSYCIRTYDGTYYSIDAIIHLPYQYKTGPMTETPNTFSLNDVYPNPFNPTGTVEFSVPEISNVSITMYNVLGQRVLEVLNKEMQPGIHNVIIDGSNLTSGTYFLRMKAADFTASKKVLLMK